MASHKHAVLFFFCIILLLFIKEIAQYKIIVSYTNNLVDKKLQKQKKSVISTDMTPDLLYVYLVVRAIVEPIAAIMIIQ